MGARFDRHRHGQAAGREGKPPGGCGRWVLRPAAWRCSTQEGMLAAYEPKGFKELTPAYSDSARPPAWVGMDV